MPQLLASRSRAFASALSAGDLEGATASFARDACLITPDGTAIHGRDQIRPVLAQMVLRRTEIEVELSNSVSAGEVMLVRERWRVRAGKEGAQLEQILHPTLVLEKIEGEWKLSIAAPWSTQP